MGCARQPFDSAGAPQQCRAGCAGWDRLYTARDFSGAVLKHGEPKLVLLVAYRPLAISVNWPRRAAAK